MLSVLINVPTAVLWPYFGVLWPYFGLSHGCYAALHGIESIIDTTDYVSNMTMVPTVRNQVLKGNPLDPTSKEYIEQRAALPDRVPVPPYWNKVFPTRTHSFPPTHPPALVPPTITPSLPHSHPRSLPPSLLVLATRSLAPALTHPPAHPVSLSRFLSFALSLYLSGCLRLEQGLFAQVTPSVTRLARLDGQRHVDRQHGAVDGRAAPQDAR